MRAAQAMVEENQRAAHPQSAARDVIDARIEKGGVLTIKTAAQDCGTGEPRK